MLYRFKISKEYKEHLVKKWKYVCKIYLFYIDIIGRIPYKSIFSINIKNNFI